MIQQIKNHINERISKLRPQLVKAREGYRHTQDASWAGRIQELDGRLSELEVILHKIQRYEEFNF